MSLCDPPFDDTFDSKVTLAGHTGGPMPEDEWPTFLAKATDLAGTVGATWTQKVREEPAATTSSTPDPVPEHIGRTQLAGEPVSSLTCRILADMEDNRAEGASSHRWGLR